MVAVKFIIGMIVVLVVVGLVIFGASEKFENFKFYFGLIDYNFSTAKVDVAYVGINLGNGDLMYYTGTKWKAIESDNFKLNEYGFGKKKMADAFWDFYVKTPRKPERLVIDANHWRYWKGEMYKGADKGWGVVKIEDIKKNNYEPSNDRAIPDNYVTYSSDFDFSYKIDYTNFLSPFFSKSPHNIRYIDAEKFAPLASVPQALTKVISWRDQILEGGSCEKFMDVKLKNEKGEEVSKKYKVKKRFEYIYIDLNDDAENERQKYDDEKCFEVEEYKDVERENWKNDKWIEIWFDGGGFVWSEGRNVEWVGDPDNVWTDFSRFTGTKKLPPHTMLKWSNNKDYFFYTSSSESYYRRYDSIGNLEAKNLMNLWEGVPDDVQAAFTWHDGKTYFFMNTNYFQYDDANNKVGKTGKLIEIWKELPSSIDAAVRIPTIGKTYFFKGTDYYQYNDEGKQEKKGIISEDWIGYPKNLKVEAALEGDNGAIFLFPPDSDELKFYKFREGDSGNFEKKWVHYSNGQFSSLREDVEDSRTPEEFWLSNEAQTNFDKGLQVLAAKLVNEETKSIKIKVTDGEETKWVNLDGVLDGSERLVNDKVSLFLYKVFDAYNLDLEPYPLKFKVYNNGVAALFDKRQGKGNYFTGIVVRGGELVFIKVFGSSVNWEVDISRYVEYGFKIGIIEDNEVILITDGGKSKFEAETNKPLSENLLSSIENKNIRQFMKDSEYYRLKEGMKDAA